MNVNRATLLRALMGLAALLLLSGCSSLKVWFTPQGQKLGQAQTLADQGHPHAASALAVEALALEPDYEAARSLLLKTFSPGQTEFRDAVARWQASGASDRWDRLSEVYRLQNTLHTVVPTLPELTDPKTGLVVDLSVASVAPELAQALSEASAAHWDRAKLLLAQGSGPRQARLALAEGRIAASFDPATLGLSDWLEEAQAAATQRLLVIPFFWEGRNLPVAVAGPLASKISRRLLDEDLPELTEVFSSDRLVTLPGGGPARLGLISQPDALKLARDAGQNLVLLGQITRSVYQEPKKVVTVESRARRVVVVDPEHPQGIEKVYGAKVTSTVWTTSVRLTASFSLVEVATGRDLATAVRDAEVSDRAVGTTYTGDREALSADDLKALLEKPSLLDGDALVDRALDSLAGSVAVVIREALR